MSPCAHELTCAHELIALIGALWMCSRACGCARAPHADISTTQNATTKCCNATPSPLPPCTHTHTYTHTHTFATHTRTRHPLTHTHTLCRWTLPLFSPRCSLAHRARALRAPPSATPWRSVHASKRHNLRATAPHMHVHNAPSQRARCWGRTTARASHSVLFYYIHSADVRRLSYLSSSQMRGWA